MPAPEVSANMMALAYRQGMRQEVAAPAAYLPGLDVHHAHTFQHNQINCVHAWRCIGRCIGCTSRLNDDMPLKFQTWYLTEAFE